MAGVPAVEGNWAFLSLGTWSVLGALTPQMINSPAAFSAGLANELTLGSFFVCRNLWDSGFFSKRVAFGKLRAAHIRIKS